MASFGHGYAVVVGAGGANGDPVGPFTIRDAESVHALLTQEAHCGFPPEQARLLIGAGAGKQAVLAALDWLAENAVGEKDTAVIFYSGHGTVAGGTFYLLTHGYKYPDGLEETAISYDELYERTRRITAGKLLILMDCCHAAGQATVTKAPGAALFKAATMPAEAAKQLAEGAGRVFIASSTADEESIIYTDMQNSVFTHHLLRALKNEPPRSDDAYVRVLNLWYSVADAVVKRTNGQQRPQLFTYGLGEPLGFAVAWHSGGLTKSIPNEVRPPAPPRAGTAVRHKADLERLVRHLRHEYYMAGGMERALLSHRIDEAEQRITELRVEIETGKGGF